MNLGRYSKSSALFLVVCSLLTTLASGVPVAADEKDAAPAAGNEVSREEWARRLTEASFQTIDAIARELAALPPDEGFAILQENWKKIEKPRMRESILAAWNHPTGELERPSRHPRWIDLLDLGMRDESPDVQRSAESSVRRLALQNFAEDFQAYKAWYETARNKPVVDVIADSIRRTVAAMEEADPATARKQLQLLQDIFSKPVGSLGDESRQTVLDAGLLKIIERWIAEGLGANADRERMELAASGLGMVARLRLDEEEVRRIALPLLADSVPTGIQHAALRVLNRKDFPWALDLALEFTSRPRRISGPQFNSDLWALVGVLESFEDPKVIPTMIALIEADNTENTIYGVGNYGLRKLTRVEFDEEHDGAWWRNWWEKNRERYPEPVRSMQIPKFTVKLDGEKPTKTVEPQSFTEVRADSATPADDSRVVWLNKNAIPVRTIRPEDDDFADLMPLRALIGKARIVQLGEQSHSDGATFFAKARLIRFLHEKMGFDVLAWESGMLDCRIAEANFRSPVPAPYPEWPATGVFPIWSAVPTVEPVFEHFKGTQTTRMPMAWCGFDCQFSTLEADAISRFVLDFFNRVDEDLLDDADETGFFRFIQGLQSGRKSTSELSPGPVEKLLKLLDEKEGAFAEVHDRREISFMRRVLRNITVLEAMRAHPGNVPKSTNARDAAMAENLLWLADEYYAGRKIIVWAASFHLLRNAPGVVPVDQPSLYERTVPMGHTVAEKLGPQVYSIAFSAYSGSAGNPFFGMRQLPTSAKGTLEELLHAAGFAHAIVDLRSVPNREGGTWLKEPQIARPLGYSPMEARWPDHFDAVFYSDVMFPSATDDGLPEEARR